MYKIFTWKTATTIAEKLDNMYNNNYSRYIYTDEVNPLYNKWFQLVLLLYIDIPPVEIWTNARKYIVEGTEIRFRCHGIDQFYIRHIQKMELVKDEISFYEWRRLWNNSITPTYNARQNYTGRYQCKATIGAASRYSPPLYLIVGSKYSISYQFNFN